jgi:hypothetical protein
MTTIPTSYKNADAFGRPAFDVLDTYTQTSLIAGAEPRRSQSVRILLGDSQTFLQYTVLGIDSSNRLVKATAAAVAAAKTIGTSNGALTFTAVKPGAAGNSILVAIAAAGTASVVVAGNTITVTPATGANTANATAAQIAAHGLASQLVSVVVGGDGSGAPTTTSATALLGGVDKITPVGVLEHVISSGASNTTIYGEVVLTGCYNIGTDDAGTDSPLVWDASFTTAALKRASTVGNPNLLFRTRNVA